MWIDANPTTSKQGLIWITFVKTQEVRRLLAFIESDACTTLRWISVRHCNSYLVKFPLLGSEITGLEKITAFKVSFLRGQCCNASTIKSEMPSLTTPAFLHCVDFIANFGNSRSLKRVHIPSLMSCENHMRGCQMDGHFLNCSTLNRK